MSYKKTVFKIQQLLLDAGADIKLLQIPKEHLEDWCTASEIIVTDWLPLLDGDPHYKGLQKNSVSACRVIEDDILKQEFDEDPGGNALQGYDDPKGQVLIGTQVGDDRLPTIRIELIDSELFIKSMEEGEKKMSFKEFLSEARKSGIAIKEEKTKGVVTKLIAELEGHEAGKLTKVARQYHSILKALKKLEEKKDELNANLKGMIGDTFDPEEDKYLTRVLASAHYTATLAKETKPEDVAEKVEIKYELLVDGLMKLLTDDLKPAGDALLEACTRRWKPDPKSPNLLVKKLDEGVVDTMRSWWRGVKKVLDAALARFDKNLPKLEKQLAAYKAMPKSKMVKEANKEANMGQFKTFVTESKSLNGYAIFGSMGETGDLDSIYELEIKLFANKSDATNAYKRLRRISEGSDYYYKMITSDGTVGQKVYGVMGYDWKGESFYDDMFFLGYIDVPSANDIEKKLEEYKDALMQRLDIDEEGGFRSTIMDNISYQKV